MPNCCWQGSVCLFAGSAVFEKTSPKAPSRSRHSHVNDCTESPEAKGPIADLLLATCGIVECGRVPAGSILGQTCVHQCVSGTGRGDPLKLLLPLKVLLCTCNNDGSDVSENKLGEHKMPTRNFVCCKEIRMSPRMELRYTALLHSPSASAVTQRCPRQRKPIPGLPLVCV